MDPYGALILAGGRSRRLGGVHKPGLRVGGASLLDRVLAAVPDAVPRIVVGPPQPVPPDVRLAREQPPGGGPVAALRAGTDAIPANAVRWLAVLAADLPFLTAAAVSEARQAASATNADGAVLTDADGRDQYLAAVYRADALREALAAVGDPAGGSMRRLLEPLTLTRVRPAIAPGTAPPWFDCDDADDLRRARTWADAPLFAPGPNAEPPAGLLGGVHDE